MNSPEIPETTFDIFLQPGEHYFGDEDTTIRTVLGSCVAMTLWHPGRRIGGMCHYMLPSRPGRRRDGEALDGRYAGEAMALLLQEIARAGSRPEEYEAKLFGGGNMFPGAGLRGRLNVGVNNVEMGRELVRRHGLRVAAEHLGGVGHRNLIFCISTGYVWMRYSAASPHG